MNLLYKYVSAERVLSCLPETGDGSLRATQPSALNDPFECAVVRTFVEGNEGDRNKELANIFTSINGTTPVREEDVAEARHQYGSLFLRELLSRQLSLRFGIVSFATDPRHPLLWSHYTVDGSGFVVGYDADQLEKLGSLRPVNYGPTPIYLPRLSVINEGNIPPLLSHKSDHWSYEEEWRLIVELNETIGTGHRDRLGQPINLLRVPNNAVKSVYYTERTSNEVVEKVRNRLGNANNRYGTTRPTKLVLSEMQFGYEDVD